MESLRSKKNCLTNIVVLILFAFFLSFSQGCATAVKGKNQEVTFKSEPEGAKVSLSGVDVGKTPLTLMLARKTDQVVTFSKDGYKSQTIPMNTTTTGWFWGNFGFLIYGPFSSTTDGVSGAIHEYSPSFFHVTMAPIDSKATPEDIRRSDSKSFIIINYKTIIEEIQTQPGQYVSSLMSLMKVSSDQKSSFVLNLKAISEQKKDIVDFADTVSKQYVK